MSAWVCTKWQIAQANINRALQNQIAWNFPLNTLPSIEGSLSILFVQSPSQFLLNNDLQGILFWTQISILLILLIFCFPDILEFDSQTVLALPTQGSHNPKLPPPDQAPSQAAYGWESTMWVGGRLSSSPRGEV